MTTERVDLKFHHGGISVPNLEASIAWYAAMLGFEVEKRFEIAAIPAKIAMLRRGDLRLELFEVPGATALPEERRHPNPDLHTHGNKHVAFAVRDIDAAERELRARGADIVLVGRFDHGNLFLRDNAGNLVELIGEPALWT